MIRPRGVRAAVPVFLAAAAAVVTGATAFATTSTASAASSSTSAAASSSSPTPPSSAASPSAAERAGRSHRGGVPIHGDFVLRQVTDQLTYLDLGTKGISQGDEFIDRDTITTADGTKVGFDAVVCTVFSSQGEFQCQVSINITGQGQLTLQGELGPLGGANGQSAKGTIAVTGGTQQFSGATGWADIDITSNALLTYRFHLHK